MMEKSSQPSMHGQSENPSPSGSQVKLGQREGEIMNPGWELGGWKSDSPNSAPTSLGVFG